MRNEHPRKVREILNARRAHTAAAMAAPLDGIKTFHSSRRIGRTYWIAWHPDHPNIEAHGNTEAEARQHLTDALRLAENVSAAS